MNLVILICFAALFFVMACGLIRLRRGPTVLDRILAFDLIATCVVAMVVLLSVRWSTPMYLEAILIVSLLGFFTTVAFVYYFFGSKSRRMPVKPDDRSTEVNS